MQAFSGGQAFSGWVLPHQVGVLLFPVSVLPFSSCVGAGSQGLSGCGQMGGKSGAQGSFPPTYFGPVLPPLRQEHAPMFESEEPAPLPELGETVCDPSLLLDLGAVPSDFSLLLDVGVVQSDHVLLQKLDVGPVAHTQLDSRGHLLDFGDPIQTLFEAGAQDVRDFLSSSML